MIQKFRWRFIIISILSLALVLFVSIGSLVYTNFSQAKNESNRVLSVLVNNNGQLTPERTRGAFDRQKTLITQDFLLGRFNPESVYQYRYISVLVDPNQKITVLNNQKIFNVSQTQIKQISKKVANGKKKRGVITIEDNLYEYQIKNTPAGEKILAFLNTSLIYEKSWMLLRLATLLGCAALIFFAIILIIVSKYAIKPIANVYNKQKQFITNAGHELKTPLAIISANTEMQEMMGNESEWTKSTKEQTQRLTELINNLIALARMNETETLTLGKVDFSEILEKTTQSFASVIKNKQLQYQVNIQKEIQVTAEEKSLTELTNILLDNAQKYCDPNGKISVKLSTSNWNKMATLTVANSYAEGKDVDYRNFFERFYREDESHNNNKKTGGFGIGLSMAKELVNVFKGKISVNYKDGQIMFVVSLHLAK